MAMLWRHRRLKAGLLVSAVDPAFTPPPKLEQPQAKPAPAPEAPAPEPSPEPSPKPVKPKPPKE